MGRVTAATVLQENGAVERYDDIDQALSTGAEGCIELHYAFGPQLTPLKAPSEEGMWRHRDLLPVGKDTVSARGGWRTPGFAVPTARRIRCSQSVAQRRDPHANRSE
jgi:hypothetical protein